LTANDHRLKRTSRRSCRPKHPLISNFALVLMLAVPTAAIAGPAKMSSGHGAPLVDRVAIFGQDDRRDLPDNLSGLEGKIGMIFEPVSQTLCTAFCVAPDVVATAAHCLFQPKGGRLPEISSLNFKLDYGKVSLSSSISGSRAGLEKNYIAVGTTQFNQEPPLSAPMDWALAKLERPVCRFGVIRVEARPIEILAQAATDSKIFQVAYHWDYKQWKLAYSGRCRISKNFKNLEWRAIQQHFAESDELVLHDCDTGGASSGSPLLMETEAGPVAVAVNVGTYTRTRLFIRQGRVIRRMKPDVIANTAVNVRAFAHIIPELEKSKLLASKEDIQRLQVELQARGLYRDKIDGDLGRKTRQAIRAFEIASGHPATGLATQKLLDLLSRDRVLPGIDYSTMPEQKP